MFRKIFKRIKLNFRRSASDRKAESLYKNYHKKMTRLFEKIKFLSKINKYKSKYKL